LTVLRNREEGLVTRYQRRTDQLGDFYNENDEFVPTNEDRNEYRDFISGDDEYDDLNEQERALFDRMLERDPFIHTVSFENVGGLVMPIPLTLTYADGTTEDVQLPAEIWRYDAEKTDKLFISDKEVVSVEIDVHHEIADADPHNNAFPQKVRPSRFELYKAGGAPYNQMADSLVELEGDEKGMSDDDSPDMPLEDASGGNQ